MKKFLPYILILIVFVGLFSPTAKVSAEADTDPGNCRATDTSEHPALVIFDAKSTRGECTGMKTSTVTVIFTPDDGSGAVALTQKPKSQFENSVDNTSCFTFRITGGCVAKALYWGFYTPSAFLLVISAKFFNALINISLSSTLFAKSDFVPSAWAIVRDLSNIFFIMILLYVAIKLILGMGGHDTKKMIGRVIVMALLINFSLFFTEVIIDSSNILALIFYNKLDVTAKDASGKVIPNPDIPSTEGERNVSGAMYRSFDPTTKLNSTGFFTAKDTILVDGQATADTTANAPGTLIAVSLVSGMVMLFAAYCFFVAGISFVSRLVELWVLIIFSPFAFMSYAIPTLEKVPYIGWSAWMSNVLKMSFMAPIFMFFMYLIFQLINNAKLFGTLITSEGLIQRMLGVIIPAVIILILLLKATDYAKKGSGKLGEMLMTGAKVVGGLALGAATGGAALLATSSVGGVAALTAGGKAGEWLKGKATTESGEDRKGMAGWLARKSLKTLDYGTKATFDIRKTKLGGEAAKKSGLNLQSTAFLGLGSKEGGFSGMRERKEKALKEESKLYKTGMSNAEVEAWSKEKNRQYDDDRDAAVNSGESSSKEEYEQKHPRPPKYAGKNAAESLNNDRLRAFQDGLGLEGLLGAFSYSMLRATKKAGGFIDHDNYKNSDAYKKEYEKKNPGKTFNGEWEAGVANEVNKSRARKIKMVVGTSAAVAAGGIIPGAALGAVGVGTGSFSAGGAAIGAVGAAGFNMRETAGEGKFSEGVDKELEKMEKVQDRIDQMKDLLEKQTEVFEQARKFEVPDENGVKREVALVVKKTNKEGKEVEEIDGKAVDEALARMAFAAQDIASRLKTLNKKIMKNPGGVPNQSERDQKGRMLTEMMEITMTTNKLNAFKTIEEKKANTETQLYNLGEKKSDIKDAKTGSAPSPSPAK